MSNKNYPGGRRDGVKCQQVVQQSAKIPIGRYCPSCGQSWTVHNDDGSCVED